MYFAQHGEDFWLERNWKYLGLPTIGTFVEVGVGDGIKMSNTLWLEQRGWLGLLIEPDRRFHESIRAIRKAQLVPYAIGKKQDPFYLMKQPTHSGFLRTSGRLATVPVKGLTNVLLEYGCQAIDLLSIDTEGTEMEVWETFDSARFHPKVVFVEWDTHGLANKREELTSLISKDGYHLEGAFGANLIFTAV